MEWRVKARAQPLEAWSWAAWGGRTRRDSAMSQPGSEPRTERVNQRRKCIL
jgi:hypothetical protein